MRKLHLTAVQECLAVCGRPAHLVAMRYKGRPKPLATVKDLPSAAARRILDGESWLSVWCQQLTVPLSTLAKQSSLPMERLSLIERDLDMPTDGELEAIARGLGTTVDRIEAIQD